MKKFIALLFGFITLFSFGITKILPNSFCYASEDSPLIIRAYGDSISAGDTLPDNENYTNGTHKICEDCFSDVFAKELIAKFGGEVKSYAHSGDKTGDLVTILNGQDNEELKKVDIFTLCIGANNVLGPALNKMSDYMVNGVNETEFREILKQGLDNFENDYKNTILPKLTQNENAKVVVMTIYNPYLHLNLDEAQVDSSLSALVDMAKSNFTQMLSITMEYLEQINQTIRQSAVQDKIFVADVRSKFDTFSSAEYKQYINADASNIVLSSFADLANIQSIMATACDPHPTVDGQEQIANVFLDVFNYAEFSWTDSFSNIEDGEKEISISFKLFKDNVLVKAYKIVNGEKNDVEIKNIENGTIKILAKNLDGQGDLFITVTNQGNNQTITSQKIAFNNQIKSADDNTPSLPDNPNDDANNPQNPSDNEPNNPQTPNGELSETQMITIYLVIGIGIFVFVLVIVLLMISSFRKR